MEWFLLQKKRGLGRCMRRVDSIARIYYFVFPRRGFGWVAAVKAMVSLSCYHTLSTIISYCLVSVDVSCPSVTGVPTRQKLEEERSSSSATVEANDRPTTEGSCSR